MPISQAGDGAGQGQASKRQRGFTLLELLVVVTILAVAAGAVMVWRHSGSGRAGLAASAALMASRIRDARARAIGHLDDARVLIDVDRRTVDAGNRLRPLQLGPDIELTATVAESERRSSSIVGIRFFPNGSSTGGTLRLARGEEAYEVRIDWFTGRVTVEAVP